MSLHGYLRLFITMCVLTSILASLGVFNTTGRISDYTTLSYKCLIIEDYEVEFVLNKPSIGINSSNLVKIPGIVKIPSPAETTTTTTSVSSPVFTVLSSEHQGTQEHPEVEYAETTPLSSNVICFESLFFSKYYGIVELYELYLGEFKAYIYIDTFVNGAPYIPGVVDGEAREYYLGVRIGVSNTTRLLELHYSNELLDMYRVVMEKVLGLLIKYKVIYGITDMDIASLKGSLGVGYAWWNMRLIYYDQLMNWYTYKYLVENGFIKGVLYEEVTTPPTYTILTNTTPTTHSTTSQTTTTITTGMTTSTPGITPCTTPNQQPASSTEREGYEEVVVSILVALLIVLIFYILLRSKRVASRAIQVISLNILVVVLL